VGQLELKEVVFQGASITSNPNWFASIRDGKTGATVTANAGFRTKSSVTAYT
jgi:hypothetical protein